MGNPLNFDDTHVYCVDEVRRHTLGGGPTGCRCEPTVETSYTRDGVIHRVIIHQKLAQADRFYDEYFGRRNA
jgi:hypothetical protein